MDKKQAARTDTGYGIVMRSVMRSTDISYGAKSIYAYLCTFAGPDGTCYPPRDLICRELHMGKSTLSSGLRELTANGYIGIEKTRHQNGTFSKNIYTINRGRHEIARPAAYPKAVSDRSASRSGGGGDAVRGTEDTNINKYNNNKYNSNNININKSYNDPKRKGATGSVFLDMLRDEGDALYDCK